MQKKEPGFYLDVRFSLRVHQINLAKSDDVELVAKK